MPSYRFGRPNDNPARRGTDRFIDTRITSASYMQTDKELRPIYTLEDLSSKMKTRDFDYAPTVLSTDFSERADAVGREILQMYAASGQGEDIGIATRLAIDATIAGAFGLDYRDVARNHSYYVSMFAGEDVEDRGFLEALSKAWQREGVDNDIAGLQNRFDASDDDEEKQRLLREIEELELKSLQLQDYSNRGWLGNTAVNTMPIMRQMAKTIGYTAAGALIGAGIGGIASGTLSTAASAGSLMKGLTIVNASSRAVRIGANAGRVVDAVVNTYARERGSLSRRLYNLVDENGNRLSDEVRNGAATTYGILSSMVEYFLPEPGLEKIVPNGLSLFMKKSLADVIQNQAKRYGARIFLGAVSESTEEAVQSLLADWKETEAKMISNAYGITEFRGRPLSEAIGDYLGNAWESFKEAFLPSLIAGLPGATFTSASEAYHNVSMNGSLRRSTPDEMAAAQEAQTVGDYDKVVPSSLLRYKRGKPSQSFMESIRPAEGEGASDSKLPSVKVKKTDNGYFEPIDDYNRDLAKYLYNKGLKGISVSIVNEDAFVEADDLGGAAELHGGFYDPDTNAVYLGSQQDADAAIGELGDSVVLSEKIDDTTTRVRYRNADGTETTVDFIADPTLADVLSGNEEAEETQPSQPLDTARMDSWLSHGDEWYSDGGLTSEMASEIRRSPENAREIMRSGLYAYIRRAVPSLSEAEANALADSNAFLMQSLASAQGRDAASFVEGLMGFGTVDGNVRGQFRSADGQSRIFLNPNEVSPTTLSHEIGHYFLITLPDGAVKDRIISAFRSEYEADGNTVGTNMQEAFSRGLADYIATGQAQNAEARSIFQRLMDAMRRFVDRVFASGGMTAEQKALYDSFFSQNQETVLNENIENEINSLSENDIGKPNATIRFSDNTPEIFRILGMPDLPMEAYRDKLARALFSSDPGKHGHSDSMSQDIMIEVAEKIDDPLYVFRSTNGKDLVAIYSVLDKKGNPILASLRAEQQANRIEVNLITSMYGKPQASLQRWVDNGLLLYVNDLENSKAALAVRLQLPSGVTASDSNVRYKSQLVNNNEIILNEDIPSAEEQLRQEERDALRDRIRRGRAAQAQRRQRFFDSIGEMVRNNVYVDAEDIHTAMDNLPLDSELRKELQQELADRDRMLIFPDSAYEIARDGRDEASFVRYISEHSSDFTEDDRRIAFKFYAYANTVRPEMQIQAFADQYSSLSGLLSLKNIIGPRRVASRSQNGRMFTRLYVPRSNVWNELKGITRNSSAAEVDAVLSSIRNNTNEWYQAYLSSLISWAKTGRRTTEDTMNDLEAIAMSYYAGKDSPIRMAEALTRRQKSESDKDIDAAEKLVSEGEASSFTREESLSDTFIERVFPKAMTEIELERERAKAREAIGRSERAIRRMSSFAKADVDARFIPVAQWLYMFMHGGRTGIFTEVIGSSATEYQNILEGRADADQGDFFLYTTIEPDASGAATIIDRYGEMQEVPGFEANLGGAVFNQQEIPAELARFLSDETIEHIHSAPRWSALTASDITDIANAMRMAKRFAQDVQAEKKRERLAKARGISIPVASRIMKSRMEFSPLQLRQVGEALGLDGPATAYQAMDYYRRNPARIFDTGDDRPNTAIGKAFKGIRDKLTDGYLGFSKMQRVARMLDGEENGPIFNAFVRDVFESYQDMLRETQRRTAEAKAAFAPIIGDPDNPSLTREQRAAERKKRSAFMEMMSKTHELAASSAFDNERKTRTLTGFDIMQMYLSSKNINGFRKLIDPDKGSGIAIEALMEYAPEEVAEFVDLELRLREAIVSDRNRINEEWNQSELRKMEADPAFIPNFRDARMTWETMPSDFRKKSFIPGDTAYLESLLDRARNTESKLNPDVKALADKMLELLSKETKRIVEADYRQRNELMVIERNYWPLINTRRQLSQPIFGDKKEAPRISTFQGMLQQRNSQAVYDVIGLNPFAIFYSAIDAQERFINMGEAIRGLDNLFDRNGGNINEVLGQVYGDKFASYFRAYAERMAGKDEFNSLMGLEFLNGLLPRLQGSYIGLSPLTVVRQYVSLISTATRGETKKGQVLSTFFRYWKDRTFREEVDERIKALAPELANTDLTQEIGWQRRMEQMQFRSDEAAARFRDFTTSWIRYHDKATKYIAWEAVYENGIASGLSEQDAAFRASEAVQETQSVGDPVSRSPLQASKNPFVRYFFMFTTDIFNTWNILFGDAVSDFREGQIKRGAERIAGFLGVCTALALIQGGWLPDEDDDDERLFGFFDINGFMADFGGEFVNGLPIFGTVVSDAIQGYSGSVPFVSDTARNWRNLTGDDKDAMERLDALVDEAMVAAGAAFGFPTSSGRRAVNAIYTPQGGFAFNPLAFLNADWGNWWKTLMD